MVTKNCKHIKLALCGRGTEIINYNDGDVLMKELRETIVGLSKSPSEYTLKYKQSNIDAWCLLCQKIFIDYSTVKMITNQNEKSLISYAKELAANAPAIYSKKGKSTNDDEIIDNIVGRGVQIKLKKGVDSRAGFGECSTQAYQQNNMMINEGWLNNQVDTQPDDIELYNYFNHKWFDELQQSLTGINYEIFPLNTDDDARESINNDISSNSFKQPNKKWKQLLLDQYVINHIKLNNINISPEWAGVSFDDKVISELESLDIRPPTHNVGNMKHHSMSAPPDLSNNSLSYRLLNAFAPISKQDHEKLEQSTLDQYGFKRINLNNISTDDKAISESASLGVLPIQNNNVTMPQNVEFEKPPNIFENKED